MREGKNREIRNVLRALDLHVNRLIRVSFGPFQLGELPDGAVEEVKTRTLREQIGPRLAAQAGADFSSPIAGREELDDEAAERRVEARPRRVPQEERTGDRSRPRKKWRGR
jgi:23S rRNA pseudouridine2605 synthase